MSTNDVTNRAAETVGLLMIGDGVVGLIRPAGHCLLWRGGPAWWRQAVEWFARHPEVTRTAAMAELAAGLWVSLRAQPSVPVYRRADLA